MFRLSVEWSTVVTFSKATLLSENTSTFSGFTAMVNGFICFFMASIGADVMETVLAEASEQNESLLLDSLAQGRLS